jgi:hypothetical protein
MPAEKGSVSGASPPPAPACDILSAAPSNEPEPRQPVKLGSGGWVYGQSLALAQLWALEEFWGGGEQSGREGEAEEWPALLGQGKR